MELLDEESLEEITTTAAVPGYMTPFAFSKSEKDKKKRLKKIKKSIKISRSRIRCKYKQ